MAAVSDSQSGLNGHDLGSPITTKRFSHIPNVIAVAVAEADAEGYEVEVDLDDINEDPTELCNLLEIENKPKNMWILVAIAYAKHRKTDDAIEVITRALAALGHARPDDRLSLLNALCWLNLFKCREAPRIKPGRLIRPHV